MDEGFLWLVDPIVLGAGQPLRHDVGVGQGAVGHRRQEEEGDGGETVQLHLASQTLDQVVNYAW